jgi:hypothetical protein
MVMSIFRIPQRAGKFEKKLKYRCYSWSRIQAFQRYFGIAEIHQKVSNYSGWRDF